VQYTGYKEYYKIVLHVFNKFYRYIVSYIIYYSLKFCVVSGINVLRVHIFHFK